jgi:hypothetical protein
MSRPALLANENMPALMVAELRRLGGQVEFVSAIIPPRPSTMTTANSCSCLRSQCRRLSSVCGSTHVAPRNWRSMCLRYWIGLSLRSAIWS